MLQGDYSEPIKIYLEKLMKKFFLYSFLPILVAYLALTAIFPIERSITIALATALGAIAGSFLRKQESAEKPQTDLNDENLKNIET